MNMNNKASGNMLNMNNNQSNNIKKRLENFFKNLS